MTNYCTVTPDRGDRGQLFEYCIKQLVKMNGGKPPVNAYIMNERPVSDAVDLIPRIREGFNKAKADGFEFMFIIESDDYYPANYFSLFGDLSNVDFVGFSSTTYYNIRNKTFEILKHKDRSSLFCTGFRISDLDKFSWPNDNEKFLDVRLWEYAQRMGKRVRLIEDNPCVGIKHGIGKCAGKGHVMQLKNQDNNLHFLRSIVDTESFEFYKQLMRTI